MNSTVSAILDERVADDPDRTFVVCEGEVVSNRELSMRADRVATAWLRRGIGQGDRIAIASRNSVDWLVVYLATARIGAVLVTLNVIYREREFTHMLGQSGARILVCEEEVAGFDFRQFFAELRPELPGVEEIVFMGDDRPADSWARVTEVEVDTDRVSAAFARVSPEDPAVILYTSGTTGTPKGAVLTHRSLLAAAEGQAERFGQQADDNLLGVMPFNHVGGITCAFGSTLVSGGTLTLLPEFHPDRVVDAMAGEGVTIFAGVPTMYTMLLAAESFTGVPTSGVRICVVGGSNLEPSLAGRVRSGFPGARLANLYGLSETSGAAVISDPDDGPEEVDTTIGTAIGDMEARIVDEFGSPVDVGGQGELQLRGSSVADGYWGVAEQTGATFLAGGWLATGDMGTMSRDGHIALHGRKKEMYVRGGYNVYPAEVENVLGAHPAVSQCAVIGYPDEKFGERGCAFIVPVSGKDVDVQELRQLCVQKVAAYKVPDRFEVVDTLPMTPAGKIRKSELKTRIAGG